MEDHDIHRNLKRSRDNDEGEDNPDSPSSSSHKSKKQEFLVDLDKNNMVIVDDSNYKFYDGVGVFDFPWLKDSVVFQVEDYLEAGDVFAPLWDGPDQGWGVDGTVWELGFDHGEGFWSSKIEDDLESVDCDWRSVIDDYHEQAVEDGNVNQGCMENL